MCFRCAEDKREFFADGSRSEEEYHAAGTKKSAIRSENYRISRDDRKREWEEGIHQRMWKPDFGTIHSAIPSSFHDSKVIRIFRIENHTLERFLLRIHQLLP